jgi:hypothetical protein
VANPDAFESESSTTAKAPSGWTVMTDDLKELRFIADVSARYHQRRRGFCMFIDRLVKGVSVLAGSAAALAVGQTIMSVSAGEWFLLGATFGIAVLNAWDLVVGFPDQAREHEDLRRKYIQLQIDIENAIELGADSDQVSRLKAQYIAIGADEKPTFWAIYAQCWNQVIIATRGSKEYLRNLPWWKLYLGYIFRMHERTFPTGSGREA